MYVITTIALVVLLGAAAWHDVSARRIPNALTVPGIVLGIVIRCVVSLKANSIAPIGAGLGGIAIAFAATFPLFALRALGGGDVKLLMAAGAFLGIEKIFPALLLSAVVGGAMGMVQAWRTGAIAPVLRGCRDLAVYCASLGRMGMRPVLGAAGTLTIPYGVAIAAGSLAGWLL
jgi:prepilin peptidase CpaA